MRVLAREIVAGGGCDGLNGRPGEVRQPQSTDCYSWYNENWQVLEERKGGSSNPYAQNTKPTRRRGDAGTRRRGGGVNRRRGEGANRRGRRYRRLARGEYATDANMNVTALVDTSGTVQERYTYDAYGQVHISDGSWTARTSSSYDNQILFGGYRFDPESGLYYVDNRMYHPTLGRWGQRDPLGFDDDMNSYLAYGNDPVDEVDPSGEAHRGGKSKGRLTRHQKQFKTRKRPENWKQKGAQGRDAAQNTAKRKNTGRDNPPQNFSKSTAPPQRWWVTPPTADLPPLPSLAPLPAMAPTYTHADEPLTVPQIILGGPSLPDFGTPPYFLPPTFLPDPMPVYLPDPSPVYLPGPPLTCLPDPVLLPQVYSPPPGTVPPVFDPGPVVHFGRDFSWDQVDWSQTIYGQAIQGLRTDAGAIWDWVRPTPNGIDGAPVYGAPGGGFTPVPSGVPVPVGDPVVDPVVVPP